MNASTVSFYTYLWLREDGTPYYAGKGIGQRAFRSCNHLFKRPSNPENIIVQEWPDEESAFEGEKLLIAIYGRKDNGTGVLRNLTDGGEGMAGHPCSPKTRHKIGAANRGRKLTPKRIQQMSDFRKGLPAHNRGIPLSKEHRRKLRQAHIGKKLSEEHRSKMSDSAKRRWALCRAI
jgi:hypothetical protein